jgi:hypothetical protein
MKMNLFFLIISFSLDLSGLQFTSSNGFTYSYQICEPVACGDNENVAVCVENAGVSVSAGAFDSAEWSESGSFPLPNQFIRLPHSHSFFFPVESRGVTITYTNGETCFGRPRKSTVRLQCSFDDTSFNVDDTDECALQIDIRTSSACGTVDDEPSGTLFFTFNFFIASPKEKKKLTGFVS